MRASGFGARLAAVRETGVLALLVLVVAGATMADRRFLDATSLNGILLLIPLIAVVALGQMMVIITRGIDVSVGSILGLAGMGAGIMFREHPGLNVFAGTGFAVLIGAGLGAINGGLIAGLRLPPIIATLGTLSAYRGLTFILSHGEQVDQTSLPDSLMGWAQVGPFAIGGVTFSWLLVIAAAVAGLAFAFLRWTRAGRNIYALGGNPEAARLRGIPVGRTTFMVYTITGALAGLAGIMYMAKFGFVNPGTAGVGVELTVIAAAVIGGTNVFGGSGTVAGVLLGTVLLSAINVALSVLGIEANWQNAVYGAVILLAVIVDSAIQASLRRATEGGISAVG